MDLPWGYLSQDRAFVDEALAPETFEAIAAAPGFANHLRRYALCRLAASTLATPEMRWLTKDLARTGIYYATLVRDAVFGGATVAGLCRSAEADHICSRGRVMAWAERALAMQVVTLRPGPEPWTQRRLDVSPGLRQDALRRLQADCEGYAGLAPELPAFAERGEQALTSHLQTLLELTLIRPDVMHGADMPISRLLHTDGGVQFVYQLVAAQKPHQGALLEDTPFAASSCARQAGISRAQLQRLLHIGEEQSLLRLTGARTISFTPTMLHNLAWVSIVMVQALRIAARVAEAQDRQHNAPPMAHRPLEA